MAALPISAQNTLAGKVTRAVFEKYEETQEDGRRGHLGASIIGRECSRQIWYSFRWARKVKHEGRLLRLFETGHKAEARFVANLRSIGCEVIEEVDGKQISFKALGGHFAGSLDGMGRNIPYAPKAWATLEFKTHSAKSFAKLIKDGVKLAKPEHYAQTQIYMLNKGVDRALYLAVNKDTDQLHDEWIHLDVEFAKRLTEKARRIIEATQPPAGISVDPSFFQCKYCDYNDVCHQGAVPDVTCRSCAKSTPTIDDSTDAKWKCDQWGCNIPDIYAQREACGSHRFIPILLAAHSEPVDYHNGDVVYKSKSDGRLFANGEGVAAFSSTEISTIASPQLLGEMAELKGMFPGSKVVA